MQVGPSATARALAGSNFPVELLLDGGRSAAMKKSTLFLLAIALALLALGSVAWAVAARQPSAAADWRPLPRSHPFVRPGPRSLGRSGSLETSQVTVIRSTNVS